MRIALVAGEASGDILGAGLMAELRRLYPEVSFEGVGGPLMAAQGLNSRVPMERLAVMGLVEVLGRLPELLRIRRRLAEHWINHPPNAFVGIDAPDFNLGLERRLRRAGIVTLHYVSPSVWAWRRGRLKTVGEAVDRVLCLLPFEADFYLEQAVDARFVGHPLADELPLTVDQAEARQALGLEGERPRLALLPGSRGGEVARLAPLFLEAARQCLAARPELEFLLPAAGPQRARQLAPLVAKAGLPLRIFEGRSREVMAASDAVLLASGTATLEAMLLKRPMVVAYRFASLSWAVISRLVRVPHVALPNLLAGEALVPELLQAAATPENLARSLLQQLGDDSHRAALSRRFTELHGQLRRGASAAAAASVLELARS